MNTDSSPRFNGTLKKWNEERGFGFLVAEHGEQELFVHVSAFARDGRVLRAGEALSFAVELDRDGRKRAVRVRRPGDADPKSAYRTEQARSHAGRRRSPSRYADSGSSLFPRLIALMLVAGLGWYVYGRYTDRVQMASPAGAPQGVVHSEPWNNPRPAQPSYQCDGRQHCSQMTSCEEAKFFLRNCPDPKMDGNNDGVPCEQQWCTGVLGGERGILSPVGLRPSAGWRLGAGRGLRSAGADGRGGLCAPTWRKRRPTAQD